MASTLGFRRAIVGIDIGTDTVKAVELGHARSGWCLRSAAETLVATGDGAVDGESDPVVVADAVRRTLLTLGMKRARVNVALSGHAVIVKRLTLPAMSQVELAEAIRWEAERCIPFDLADVQLDFQVVAGSGASGNTRTVLLVAARKDRVEDRLSLIAQAGHEPAVLDVEAFALANAYRMNYPDRADALAALVHVGRSATLVCVLEQGQLVFTRDFAMGGRLHAEALQREASHLPREVTRDQAASILRDVSTQCVLEIRKTIDFYRANAPIETMSRVVLSGGSHQAEGLRELLAAEFSAPVDVFDPFRRVVRPKKVHGNAPVGPAYAVAVGLAMRRPGDR